MANNGRNSGATSPTPSMDTSPTRVSLSLPNLGNLGGTATAATGNVTPPIAPPTPNSPNNNNNNDNNDVFFSAGSPAALPVGTGTLVAARGPLTLRDAKLGDVVRIVGLAMNYLDKLFYKISELRDYEKKYNLSITLYRKIAEVLKKTEVVVSQRLQRETDGDLRNDVLSSQLSAMLLRFVQQFDGAFAFGTRLTLTNLESTLGTVGAVLDSLRADTGVDVLTLGMFNTLALAPLQLTFFNVRELFQRAGQLGVECKGLVDAMYVTSGNYLNELQTTEVSAQYRSAQDVLRQVADFAAHAPRAPKRNAVALPVMPNFNAFNGKLAARTTYATNAVARFPFAAAVDAFNKFYTVDFAAAFRQRFDETLDFHKRNQLFDVPLDYRKNLLRQLADKRRANAQRSYLGAPVNYVLEMRAPALPSLRAPIDELHAQATQLNRLLQEVDLGQVKGAFVLLARDELAFFADLLEQYCTANVERAVLAKKLDAVARAYDQLVNDLLEAMDAVAADMASAAVVLDDQYSKMVHVMDEEDGKHVLLTRLAQLAQVPAATGANSGDLLLEAVRNLQNTLQQKEQEYRRAVDQLKSETERELRLKAEQAKVQLEQTQQTLQNQKALAETTLKADISNLTNNNARLTEDNRRLRDDLSAEKAKSDRLGLELVKLQERIQTRALAAETNAQRTAAREQTVGVTAAARAAASQATADRARVERNTSAEIELQVCKVRVAELDKELVACKKKIAELEKDKRQLYAEAEKANAAHQRALTDETKKALVAQTRHAEETAALRRTLEDNERAWEQRQADLQRLLDRAVDSVQTLRAPLVIDLPGVPPALTAETVPDVVRAALQVIDQHSEIVSDMVELHNDVSSDVDMDETDMRRDLRRFVKRLVRAVSDAQKLVEFRERTVDVWFAKLGKEYATRERVIRDLKRFYNAQFEANFTGDEAELVRAFKAAIARLKQELEDRRARLNRRPRRSGSRDSSRPASRQQRSRRGSLLSTASSSSSSDDDDNDRRRGPRGSGAANNTNTPGAGNGGGGGSGGGGGRDEGGRDEGGGGGGRRREANEERGREPGGARRALDFTRERSRSPARDDARFQQAPAPGNNYNRPRVTEFIYRPVDRSASADTVLNSLEPRRGFLEEGGDADVAAASEVKIENVEEMITEDVEEGLVSPGTGNALMAAPEFGSSSALRDLETELDRAREAVDAYKRQLDEQTRETARLRDEQDDALRRSRQDLDERRRLEDALRLEVAQLQRQLAEFRQQPPQPQPEPQPQQPQPPQPPQQPPSVASVAVGPDELTDEAALRRDLDEALNKLRRVEREKEEVELDMIKKREEFEMELEERDKKLKRYKATDKVKKTVSERLAAALDELDVKKQTVAELERQLVEALERVVEREAERDKLDAELTRVRQELAVKQANLKEFSQLAKKSGSLVEQYRQGLEDKNAMVKQLRERVAALTAELDNADDAALNVSYDFSAEVQRATRELTDELLASKAKLARMEEYVRDDLNRFSTRVIEAAEGLYKTAMANKTDVAGALKLRNPPADLIDKTFTPKELLDMMADLNIEHNRQVSAYRETIATLEAKQRQNEYDLRLLREELKTTTDVVTQFVTQDLQQRLTERTISPGVSPQAYASRTVQLLLSSVARAASVVRRSGGVSVVSRGGGATPSPQRKIKVASGARGTPSKKRPSQQPRDGDDDDAALEPVKRTVVEQPPAAATTTAAVAPATLTSSSSATPPPSPAEAMDTTVATAVTPVVMSNTLVSQARGNNNNKRDSV